MVIRFKGYRRRSIARSGIFDPDDYDAKSFTKAMNKNDHKALSGWIRQKLREAAEVTSKG